MAKLKRNNYVVNRIKLDNEQIYYIIDAINDAINAGKQISFQYYDYTGLKKKVLKNKGEDVTTLAYDMTSFRGQTEVSASSTFFG